MCTCKPQQCFGETQVQLLKYINDIIKFKEYENLALKIFSLHVYEYYFLQKKSVCSLYRSYKNE